MKSIYFMMILFFITIIAPGCYSDPANPDNTASSSVPSETPTASQPANTTSAQASLTAVIEAGKEGKVPGEPFVAGETDMSTIEKSWGAPKKQSDTKAGIYAAYEDRSTVFGYYRHSPIFDVRSYNKSIQSLTLNDIKQAMGDPDKVLHYDSEAVHQQIWVYPLSGQYQLKWVMPKPDEQNPNPHIDHISIYNPQVAEHSLDAEINRMSLDEKIGQMMMVGINGTSPGADAVALIKQHHVGGVILYGGNIQSAAQTVQFTNRLKELNTAAHNPMPLLISVDEEGGEVDRMPDPIFKMPSSASVGKVHDANFAYRVGQVLGRELLALGFNVDYAPVLDVNVHPGKSVIGSRSLGSNPDEVSRLGAAVMNGIQSKNVISVIKHFPGYGSVTIDAHKDLPSLQYGTDSLEKIDWVPYKHAIGHGADIVMVTHLLVPQLKTRYPASMSPVIITDMLRKKLGFQGVVITDDMTMGAIANHYDMQTAALRSVQAGADIVMVAFHQDRQEAAIQTLKQAVENGTLSEARIDDSVYRIIRLKQKYKLSDRQIKEPDIRALNAAIRSVMP